MEGNSWRPAAGGPAESPAVDSASVDWRSQLQPDARQRIVNKIMDTLKRHLPISVPEGLSELKKIAVRFEEKIYTAATNRSDYLRKISLKMLSMEAKTQSNNQPLSNPGVGNQNPADSGSDGRSAEPPAVDSASVDWRSQLQPDARQRIVNKIMDTLKRHLPISVPEGLSELKKIAVRFEEKIYTAATNQSDYLRNISLKMLSMETKTQNNNQPLSNPGVGNQNPADSASVDSTAQTGQAGAVDWQEEAYQKIKSLKESYLAELNELQQKIALKFQQHEELIPAAKQSEQFEKMKNFKQTLDRAIGFLQINKSNIHIGMKDKLPQYEKQIMNFVLSNRSKKIAPSQPQGHQAFQYDGHAHSKTQQHQSQASQLQQHDNHVTQAQQKSLQGSVASLKSAFASSTQHGSVSLSTHATVSTTQPNMGNSLQSAPNLDPLQGSSFSSLQQGVMVAVQQDGVSSLQISINGPQQTNLNSLSQN